MFTTLSILSLLFISCSTLAVPLSISPNTKYTFTNRYTIGDLQTYGTVVNGASPSKYTFNYPYPVSDSNQMAILSYDQLNTDFGSSKINISIQIIAINNTCMDVGVKVGQAMKIKKLSIRVYVASSIYSQSPIFVSFSASAKPLGNISSTKNYTLSYPKLPESVGIIKSAKVFYTLIGLSIAATDSSNTLGIYLEIIQINSTAISVILGCKQIIPTYVESFSFTWISFDPFIVNFGIGNFAMDLNNVTSTSGQSLYSKTVENSFNFNTMFGMTGFCIQNNSNLNFGFSITDPNALNFVTTNNFSYFLYNYLIVQTNYCKYNTPYFFAKSNLCYDSCPAGSYSNNTDLTCKVCLYDCYTCTSNATCSTCDASKDFRVLNGSLGRCVPVKGYYQSGVTKASKCKLGCETCSNGSKCISCVVGYKIDINSDCQIVSKPTQQNLTKKVISELAPTKVQSKEPELNKTNGKNRSNSTQKQASKPTTLTIGSITMSAVALITIIVVIVFLRKKCWRERNKIVNNMPNLQQKVQIVQTKTMSIENLQEIENTDIGRAINYKRQQSQSEEWVQMMDIQFVTRERCSVDFQPNAHLRLQCGHFFHWSCAISLKQRNGDCPTCEKQIKGQGRLFCQGCNYRYKKVSLINKLNDAKNFQEKKERFCKECALRN